MPPNGVYCVEYQLNKLIVFNKANFDFWGSNANFCAEIHF
jgi:hypothetical protein